jgi:septal ring factor EnvC (AmiA/AmiB activator)
MTDQENNNGVSSGVWVKIRIVIGLALLAAISYEMGLSHARSERNKSDYSALRAQYDRIETENSALRAQYDRVLTEYSASKTQCSETLTKYSALMAQYERIEAQRTKASQQ